MPQFNAAKCKELFESITKFASVACIVEPTRVVGLDTIVDYVLSARFNPIPQMNNLFTHDGEPALGQFSCDDSGITCALLRHLVVVSGVSAARCDH